MSIRETKAHVVGLHYDCDTCGQPMTSHGPTALLANPVRFPHVCPNGHRANLDARYPGFKTIVTPEPYEDPEPPRHDEDGHVCTADCADIERARQTQPWNPSQEPTPEQHLDWFLALPRSVQIGTFARYRSTWAEAATCFMQDHAARLEDCERNHHA